ncbi:MAG: ATP-binding protein [Lewinellaceae bacterium]|nr:ATP-binding protein [Phaeodactylibacter sp.]MCB9039812.1 ATP-binding protein [Lewinellaceae bacterium]
MKNIVGQTPRGQDFFPRDGIINRVYRRLDGGAHIFLAAPRRVGKTSIMRFLEDNPRKGYHFVYVITESAHSSEEFFQRLLEEVLKSPAIGQLAKKKENIASLVKQVIGRIERIKFPWVEVDMERKKEETFHASFEKLTQEYDQEEGTLTIMIDEFPQTVENIKVTHGSEEAIRFLRLNREQRQKADQGIRFLYTGSIGLPSVVKKLTSTSVINDLNVIDIPPFSQEEARKFTQTLLDNYQVQYSPATIDHLLNMMVTSTSTQLKKYIVSTHTFYNNGGTKRIRNNSWRSQTHYCQHLQS